MMPNTIEHISPLSITNNSFVFEDDHTFLHSLTEAGLKHNIVICDEVAQPNISSEP